LSEDTKKREILSEDTLDNVAGGTFEQNVDLLNAMAQIDPNSVQAILREANKTGDIDKYKSVVSQGLDGLIQKHFGDELRGVPLSSSKFDNYYQSNGKKISHQQALNIINAKAQGWEIS
jgi:hypothetical protein